MNWGSSGENRGTIGWGIAENRWPKWDPPFWKFGAHRWMPSNARCKRSTLHRRHSGSCRRRRRHAMSSLLLLLLLLFRRIGNLPNRWTDHDDFWYDARGWSLVYNAPHILGLSPPWGAGAPKICRNLTEIRDVVANFSLSNANGDKFSNSEKNLYCRDELGF